MAKHSYNFAERYKGLVGFGLNRETDESTVIYCLQKFSDDRLQEYLRGKLTDAELEEIFNMVMRILKTHLSEPEYHWLFLKDDEPGKQ